MWLAIVPESQSLPYIVDMPPKSSSAANRSKSKRQKLEIESSKVVYKGPVFSVTSDRVTEPTGVVAQRDVVRHPGSVVILAVDDSGTEPLVLLERQYRYAAQDYLWELPAGSLDRGEQALTGAKRELLEETGYRAKKWKRALHFYPSPGFLSETMTVYLARELTVGEAQPEEDEVLKYQMMPLSRVIAMVKSGKIRDGKTISGVLWLAQTHGQRPQGKK